MAETKKIVILGSGGVGKSALTVQYVSGIFVSKYDPTIEDSYRKQEYIDGKPITLEILDTAGTEQFTAMRQLYMKQGDGFLLVYSLTSKGSAVEIPDLYEQILRTQDRDNVPCVLVGNKCDLPDQRELSPEYGASLAQKLGCVYAESTAKDSVSARKVFHELIRLIQLQQAPKTKVVSQKKSCSLL